MKLVKYLKLTITGKTKKECLEQYQLLNSMADTVFKELCLCDEPLEMYNSDECAICHKVILPSKREL